MAKNRPNILIVLTDQQAASALSCAGNPELHTPNLDRLASRGVRFDNAYCTFPLCSPARASMFSGLMPHQCGVTDNGRAFKDATCSHHLGHLFAAAGYDCAYGGKWHIRNMDIGSDHGFRQICGHDDVALADACVDFLGQAHSKPFLLVASFDDPHTICHEGRHQPNPWGEIPDVPTEECPSLPANFATPPYEPQFLRVEMAQFPGAFERPHSAPLDWWRHYRHKYLRIIERVDTRIGRILDALDQHGLTDNTLVIFTSDHGEGAGAHQWKKKRFLYEEAVRVPLIVSYPGVVPEGRVDTDHLVSNGLDLIPSLCAFCDVACPDGLPGLNLQQLFTSEPPAWRDHLISVTRGGRMVRTDRYKYVVYSWGAYREVLTDLRADPGEMVNLAVNSRCRSILDEHRRLLRTWIEATDDPFMRRSSFDPYPAKTTGV